MDESLKRQIHEECRIRNRSEGTCKQHTFHIGKFLDWIGDKPLNELTLYDAREYIIKKRNDGVKPESCNGINSALVFFYRYILHITWDLDIVPRMKRDWTLPQVISKDDVEKLIDTAINIRNKAIIALTYSAGLRVGEVCNSYFKAVDNTGKVLIMCTDDVDSFHRLAFRISSYDICSCFHQSLLINNSIETNAGRLTSLGYICYSTESDGFCSSPKNVLWYGENGL